MDAYYESLLSGITAYFILIKVFIYKHPIENLFKLSCNLCVS